AAGGPLPQDPGARRVLEERAAAAVEVEPAGVAVELDADPELAAGVADREVRGGGGGPPHVRLVHVVGHADVGQADRAARPVAGLVDVTVQRNAERVAPAG